MTVREIMAVYRHVMRVWPDLVQSPATEDFITIKSSGAASFDVAGYLLTGEGAEKLRRLSHNGDVLR